MNNLKSTVEYILRTKPKARNDDFILIDELYKTYGINTNTPFSYIVNHHKFLRLPSFESITRCRRKLQEEHEELKACDIVTIARSKKEAEYRELLKK